MSVKNNKEKVETYPLDIDYLPDEFRRKAELELHETAEDSTKLLKQLKTMLKSTDDLKDIDFHDDYIRQYLRHSKFDVHKSLKRMQEHIKFRKDNSVMFGSVDFEEVSKTPDYKFATPLPFRCQDGCSVAVFEYSKWDPSGITLENLVRIGLLIYQQCLRNPLTQINGFKMIVDYKDARMSQLKFMNLSFLYRSYKAFMVCTPARTKEIHMVNENVVMKTLWTVIKPFLPEKFKQRVFFHSAPEDLLKHFPKHVLPVQYGGDIEDYYMEEWVKEAIEQNKLYTLAGHCNTF